ncbi:hypothetical protein [Sphingomonas sp.]|jgi:hypothetical protein|uniref:hypothetical protein n=1 Tax=Sphingomonas sp. TaxID=28214 RepID=UPI0035C7DDB7
MIAVERRVALARGRIAALLRARWPDAAVQEDPRGVVVTGRRVMRRWIDDPRLAWWRE